MWCILLKERSQCPWISFTGPTELMSGSPLEYFVSLLPPDHWRGAGDHVLPALHGQEHDWGGHHQEGWGAKALATSL